MRKEIPILFSTEMVQAILDDRKIMTRRIMKPQPDPDGEVSFMPNPPLDFKGKWKPWKFDTEEGESKSVECPYGKPGDILYLRENWRVSGWNWGDGTVTLEYQDGSFITYEIPDDLEGTAQKWAVNHVEGLKEKGIFELESDDSEELVRTDAPHPFSPNIHLPKWCSRIWLQNISIRAERLHWISDDGCIAEGIRKVLMSVANVKAADGKIWEDYRYPSTPPDEALHPRPSYESLWESINGPGSWEANPWVWVIEFKVISTTGKPANFA